jgi:hypothetical protein
VLSVYKTTLEITDEQKVTMQKGSGIIKVANQNGKLTLWYLCDPEAELVEETFYVVGTGQQLPDTFPGLYVDSVINEPAESLDGIRDRNAPRDGFVWHVFFKRRPNVQRGEPIVVPPAGGE